MNNVNIGFIGGGNMANCLVNGLISSGFPANKLWVSDPNTDKLEHLKKTFSIQTSTHNADIIQTCDVIVLATKPQDIPGLLKGEEEAFSNYKPLLISIAVGIPVSLLQKKFGVNLSIVRAMPNTPAILGVGATGLYANSKVSEDQKELAESILRAVGITVWVNHESDIDVVAAISGSGPAYFFRMMNSLQAAGVALGLPSKTAKLLTLQTALGAARMAMESDLSLEDLIKTVASKGGTTEKALEVLETLDMEAMIKKAVEAAKERAKALASESF